jgi:hypothetical protein
LLAAVAQVSYWDKHVNRLRALRPNPMQRYESTDAPNWAYLWRRRRQTEAVVRALIRRSLPLRKNDLLTILNWCNSGNNFSESFAPIRRVTHALQRYAAASRCDATLRLAMKRLATKLNSSDEDNAQRFGTSIELLCSETQR